MRKRTIWVAALGLGAILLAGGLFASNMGFKLNYAIPGGGLDGTTSIGLPYNAQVGLTTASQLLAAVPNGTGIGFLNGDSNLFVRYTGIVGSPADFNLVSAEGYAVTVNAASNYIIVGSHNPGLGVNFSSGGLDGTSLWSYPYHSTIPDASTLLADIPNATGIGFLNPVNNLTVRYTGIVGSPPDFPLVPGESYFVTVSADVVGYIPPHY